MIEIILLTTFLIILTLFSGFFSGSETALFSLSPMRVKTYHSDLDPRKRLIAALLHRPRDLLVTVFMLNTLVNILLQNASSRMFGAEAGWGLKVGVPLFITLFLGEIIPKNICMQHNVSISYYVVPYVNFFHRMLASVRKITIAITHPISRVMFFFLKREASISRDEMKHVLITSEKHGVLHPDEATLVWGYLKLQDATVKEIQAPREDVLHYEVSEPLSKLTHLFVDQECSRIPVCRENMDHVLGIITAKQFFLYGHEISRGEEIERLLQKPFYVPETTPARTVMRQFNEMNEVIALVVDEYGSISGLVTREDIAELVVGEITDRRDLKPLFTKSGKNEIIASGKLELAEFNKIFNVELTSPTNMVTIGGWLTEQMGVIPKGGTTFEANNFLFQVLAADPNRIRRLYIRKLRVI